MGPPASHRVSRVWWYSGVIPAGVHFEYEAFTLYRLPSQVILLYTRRLLDDPQPLDKSRFGLFPVRSPLLRESMFLSLPPGT